MIIFVQFFKNESEIEKSLCAITTPSLNNNQINLCEIVSDFQKWKWNWKIFMCYHYSVS